jgi:hypothetical protein
MNEQNQGTQNPQQSMVSNSDRERAFAEFEERFKQSQLVYGKRQYKQTSMQRLATRGLDENYEPTLFWDDDLQGEMEVTIGMFKSRFKSLGIEQTQLVELFPEVDFTMDSETRFVIETKRVIKALRDMGVYEEDLFEQFHDLIPNYHDRSLAWRK